MRYLGFSQLPNFLFIVKFIKFDKLFFLNNLYLYLYCDVSFKFNFIQNNVIKFIKYLTINQYIESLNDTIKEYNLKINLKFWKVFLRRVSIDPKLILPYIFEFEINLLNKKINLLNKKINKFNKLINFFNNIIFYNNIITAELNFCISVYNSIFFEILDNCSVFLFLIFYNFDIFVSFQEIKILNSKIVRLNFYIKLIFDDLLYII